MENRNSYLSLGEHEKFTFLARDWYLQCLESMWISPLHGAHFLNCTQRQAPYYEVIVELPFSINRVFVLFT